MFDMKNLICSFVFSLVTMALLGQITITSASFPNEGDTLQTRFTSVVADGFDIGGVGGPQNWDFNALNIGQPQTDIYIPASEGPDNSFFPEANLIRRSGQQDQYILSTATQMIGIGLGGNNALIDIPLNIRYSIRPILRQSPLSIFSLTSSNGEFRIDLSSNIIPDTLLSLLPIKPDSIRIQFTNSTRGLINAFGTLTMQGKSFDVIRERAESINDTKIFIKVLGFWIDPISLGIVNIPGDFGSLLGKDTTIIYNFYSNIRKEILVSAEYNNQGVFEGASFADLGGIIAQSAEIPDNTFNIYPNPSSGNFVIKNGASEGLYIVSILDSQGKIQYLDLTQIQSEISIDVNNKLPHGVYFLFLMNAENRRTFSTKLIIQ